MDKYEELKKIIDTSKNTVLFTGAGISCPSGIPDFRSADGLYNEKGGGYSPEQIISHSFFVAHPKEFYEFYKSKMVYPKAKPNAAHRYFAKLEEEGKLSAIVTQNIDGLHQAAGSKNVLEFHGSVHRNHCMRCGKFFDVNYVMNSSGAPKCDKCGGPVKPDVVLYEEGIDADVFEKSVAAIENAQTVIVVGTSLAVYPAAGLLTGFRGENLVLVNKQATPFDRYATLVFNEDVVNVVKRLESMDFRP
ncbi:MAG: NAD-dependent protein deacylase [Eubacteriales bacterium]|nr:NAD-dependent protein deacylase [Faecalibacterium sp.]MDY6151300.1 NAD-dependent protein deacylase [Eubacteriales bacterium]